MIGVKQIIAGLGWKVGAIAATSVLVATGIWLAVVQWENYRLTSYNQKLDAKINDPATGYIVLLTQSRTNVVSLEGAIKDQADLFKLRADQDAKVLAATQAALNKAQVATRAAERTAASLLAVKPRGATLEARVIDVDSRILESLK